MYKYFSNLQRITKIHSHTVTHSLIQCSGWNKLNITEVSQVLYVSICRRFSGKLSLLGSIVVSIPACHAGDRGSIPRRGEMFLATCCKKYPAYLWKLNLKYIIILAGINCYFHYKVKMYWKLKLYYNKHLSNIQHHTLLSRIR